VARYAPSGVLRIADRPFGTDFAFRKGIYRRLSLDGFALLPAMPLRVDDMPEICGGFAALRSSHPLTDEMVFKLTCLLGKLNRPAR